jgi:hypothetical protein
VLRVQRDIVGKARRYPNNKLAPVLRRSVSRRSVFSTFFLAFVLLRATGEASETCHVHMIHVMPVMVGIDSGELYLKGQVLVSRVRASILHTLPGFPFEITES